MPGRTKALRCSSKKRRLADVRAGSCWKLVCGSVVGDARRERQEDRE